MSDFEKVIDTYSKIISMEESNTHFVYLMTATYIVKTHQKEPVWMLAIAPSGYGKSLISYPLFKMAQDEKYNVLLLDQVTSKAFASGYSSTNSNDLGKILNDKNTLIYVPDMASLLAPTPEESKPLYALFRTLYDGFIKRDTGKEVKFYPNCYVNMFACSTPYILNDIDYMQNMGTREIVYKPKKLKNIDAILNADITQKEKDKIADSFLMFIDRTSFVFEEPDSNTKSFLKNLTMEIIKSHKRDDYPFRLYKQLKSIYTGLKALELPDETIKKVLKEI